LATALAAAAVLAGCSTLKVKTQFDPTAPYPTYKTYAWLATQPGQEQAAAIRNPAVRSLVVDAVDREMKRKGFVRTTPDQNPDFLVSVIGWGQSRVEITNYGYAYGGAYVYGPWGPSAVAAPIAEVNQYTDGTLILDFVDAQSKKLFWRGTATDTLTTPEQVPNVVDGAVRKLLEQYPPKK
jgi:hypothetical protein